MIYLLSFIGATSLGALVFAHFQKNRAGSELITIYLLNFVAQFLLLDLGLQYVKGGRSANSAYYFGIAFTMAMGYVCCVWGLGRVPSFVNNSRLALNSLLTAGYSFARYGILIWLVVRVYLYAKYGAQSFSYISLFDQTARHGLPISYADSVLRSIVLYLANGAAMVLVVRLAIKGWRGISLVDWPLLLIFGVFVLLGEAPLGVRRTVILYVMIFAFTFLTTRRVSGKTVTMIILLGVLAVAFMGYYQRIRFNGSNPEIYRMLSSGNASQVLAGIVAYLTPQPPHDTTRVFRSGALDFLATSIRVVDESGRMMEGSLLLFTVLKVIPSAIYPKKSLLDDDEVVAQFYRLEHRDYATNMLATLYMDFGVASVVLAPLLWWAVMYVVLAILARSTKNGALAVGTAGMVFGLLSMVESSMIPLFMYVRDIVVVLPLFYLIGLVGGRYKDAEQLFVREQMPDRKPQESGLEVSSQPRRYPLLLDKAGKSEHP